MISQQIKENITLLDRDPDTLKKMILCLDVLGKPFYKILEGMDPSALQVFFSMVDLIMEYYMGDDAIKALAYKKSVRCFEGMYHLFRDEDFLKIFNKFQKDNQIELIDQVTTPTINEDGTLTRWFRVDYVKYFTPGFERDDQEIETKIKGYSQYISAMIPGEYHLKVMGTSITMGPQESGRYERRLEGFGVIFGFPGQ